MSHKAPYCPKNLSKRAKELWKELVPMLFSKGYASEEDVYAISLLCESIAEIESSQEAIATLGTTTVIETKTGSTYMQISPYITVREKAMDRFLKLADRFGMNPASRKKMSVEAITSKPADTLESLLS